MVQAPLSAPPRILRGGDLPFGAAAADESALRPVGPVVLRPRRIPGGVAATLDGLPADALPRFHYDGLLPGLRRSLRAAVWGRLPRPRWLANWLLDDMLDKVALMIELTGASALRVRLDIEGGRADTPFAMAEAGLRLVTSYRGPGIEWMSPRVAAALQPGLDPPAAALRHLPRGDVAILRGWGDGAAGVPHRTAAGAVPLRLTIDDAGGRRRDASWRTERSDGALQ